MKFRISNLIIPVLVTCFIFFVWKNLKQETGGSLEQIAAEEPTTVFADYSIHSSFKLPFCADALALADSAVYLASDTTLYKYTLRGAILQTLPTRSNIMDICVDAHKIYVLHAESIEVYSHRLDIVGGWEACDNNSYFGQMAVAHGKVYATDSDNKLIWRFGSEGNMEGQIASPDGFIVPGYQFAISVANDTIYCANPGTHRIERYTLGGKFIDAFGSRGTAEGSFAGCCNPCGIVVDRQKHIFTAEKGISRVSVFGANGTYLGTLLSNRQLDGGSAAPLISGNGNRLAVANKSVVMIFEIQN